MLDSVSPAGRLSSASLQVLQQIAARPEPATSASAPPDAVAEHEAQLARESSALQRSEAVEAGLREVVAAGEARLAEL